MATMVTPNLTELQALIQTSDLHNMPIPRVNTRYLSHRESQEVQRVLPYILWCLRHMVRPTKHQKVTLLTLGDIGAVCAVLSPSSQLQIHFTKSLPTSIPTLSKDEILSVSGAGDSFLGGFLSSYLQNKSDISAALKRGSYCAYESLRTYDTISDCLDVVSVDTKMEQWDMDATLITDEEFK